MGSCRRCAASEFLKVEPTSTSPDRACPSPGSSTSWGVSAIRSLRRRPLSRATSGAGGCWMTETFEPPFLRLTARGYCASRTPGPSSGSTGEWRDWRRWSVPLPEPLQKIGDEVLHHFVDGSPTTPYMLYVYEPEAELAVRREMQDLVAYLTAHGTDVAAVSLAELFWQAVDSSGF